MSSVEKRLTTAPTILDVARRAGVSVATVSHVINRTRKRISPEVRERVEQAIRELGYRPNYVARALKRRTTQTVGVVLRDLADPGSHCFLDGLAAVVRERAIGVLLAVSEGRWGAEAEAVADLLARQVDGLVVQSVSPQAEHLRAVCARGVPLIVVDALVEEPGALCLLPDYAEGVRLALNHLWEQGHRRIGFIAGAVATAGRQEAFAAYQAFWTERGRAWSVADIRTNASSVIGGYKALTALLRHSEGPTAAIVVDHWMTLGAFQALLTSGRAPTFALVGWGDAAWAQAIPPGLTVVDLPMDGLGRLAGEQLVALLAEGRPATGVIWVPPRLIVRGSTGSGGNDADRAAHGCV